jgi:hypothetical protein
MQKMKISARTLYAISALLLGLSTQLRADETVFQNGLDDYQGTQDTNLRGSSEELKVANLWGDHNLYISGVPMGGFQMMALIRFDGIVGTGKNQIPPGVTITKARLELFKVENYPKDEGQYEKDARFAVITAYPMKTSFVAGDSNDPKKVGGATFSYRNNDPDLPQYWGNKNQLETGPVAGVDYDPALGTTTKVDPAVEKDWMQWDLTEDVRGWVADKSTNHGLYLMAQGWWTGGLFRSSEAEQSWRPRLVVEWTKP